MVVRTLLVTVLVMGVLFAWRAWRHVPSLAILAGAVAAVTGVLLLRTPGLAIAGLLVAGLLISFFSRPRS
jgi:hypothetical protein